MAGCLVAVVVVVVVAINARHLPTQVGCPSTDGFGACVNSFVHHRRQLRRPNMATEQALVGWVPFGGTRVQLAVTWSCDYRMVHRLPPVTQH
jgi:hypothetical protein